MSPRLFRFALPFFLITLAFAKDKNTTVLPADVLQARTVLVVLDPDSGEPLDQPYTNSNARENVEKALLEWGRFDLLMDGAQADLIITVRVGNNRLVEPTIKGGPIGQRPGVGQSTDSTIRIGAQQGQAPPLQDPSVSPPNRGPRMSNEVGSGQDEFTVYRGNVQDPLDSPPVWRYVAKDCLSAPKVQAVEEFRKLIAKAEKPKAPKKP